MKLPLLRNFLLILVACLFSTVPGWSQNGKKYELLPAPDLWYNDVDGIRVGGRVIGQVPGTFGDGPHRLDAGIWLGTWMPDVPVSYYLSFTEPIPAISDFNSEGNIELTSSIRTGISRHGIRLNKRWQNGFEELNHTKLSIGIVAQKRFDREYVPFEQMWQERWLGLLAASIEFQNDNSVGRHLFRSQLHSNLIGKAASFANLTGEFQQVALLGSGFEFRGRLFVGLSTDDTVPEFLFAPGLQSASGWIENGLTRAKGTIPVTWMESGIFQIAGGANLRGYTNQNITALEQGGLPLFTSLTALNAELDYPNPIDRAIQKVPVIGGILKLRSYIFFDTGTSAGFTQREETRMLSDAGAGFMFSLNIPNALGEPRGIMLRYDIPAWLSHPEGDDHFSYRSVVGIGAIFSL